MFFLNQICIDCKKINDASPKKNWGKGQQGVGSQQSVGMNDEVDLQAYPHLLRITSACCSLFPVACEGAWRERLDERTAQARCYRWMGSSFGLLLGVCRPCVCHVISKGWMLSWWGMVSPMLVCEVAIDESYDVYRTEILSCSFFSWTRSAGWYFATV